MDLGALLFSLVIALIVKVAVMVLAARLLLRFYGVAHVPHGNGLLALVANKDLPGARWVWWSVAFFLTSELFCGIEVYILLQFNFYTSTVHALASAAGMASFAIGLLYYFDAKIIRHGQAKCVLNRICNGCDKRDGSLCKFNRFLLLASTLMICVSIVPFFVPLTRLVADVRRYILPFPALNAWYDGSFIPLLKQLMPSYEPLSTAFVMPHAVQVLEFRILPAVAFIALTAAIYFLRRRDEMKGMILTLSASGILAYTYLELVLNRLTGDILLGSFLHEVSELWFLIAAAELLRILFRERILTGEQTVKLRSAVPEEAKRGAVHGDRIQVE